jgi:gamma-glutamyltranspeptidase / glutathione hydrolase
LIFLLPFLLFFVSCAVPDVDTGPVNRAGLLYSEKHIDFAAWDRKNDCCVAHGERGAVASGGTNASKAGIEILKSGGNAVDAAVATAFVLSVERPHSAGLGGGGFMTLHIAGKKDKTKGNFFVDFREMAPKNASRDMYLDNEGNVVPKLSLRGALSIATPGFVAGLEAIHRKWGRAPWKKLLEPAIKVAEEGFTVYPSLSKRIESERDCLQKEETTRALLFKPDGTGLKKGEKLIQKDLAQTLRAISESGSQALTSGKIADSIVEYIKSRGGILTHEDLKGYKVKFRKPVESTFKDYTFLSAPPPSAGGVAIAEILNILEKYDLPELVKSPENYLHVLTESMRFAYADRSLFIGDPDFVKNDYSPLLSKEYATKLQARISPGSATPSDQVKPGELLVQEGNNTTHLSILDSEGNAVASTITINDSFGSCLVPTGTGIFLNDEMDDFSAKPGAQNVYGLTGGDANAIAPLKRPVSSMSPTIVFRGGKPVLAVGAAGGSRIITSVLQTILNNLIVYPGNLRKSVFAPRIHHQWVPDKLNVEDGIPEALKEKLRAKGHDVQPPPFSPLVQAVSRESNDDFSAVFDPRDEGGAEGY